MCQYRCRLKEGDNEIYEDIQRGCFKESIATRKQKYQLSFKRNGSGSGYNQQLASKAEKWNTDARRR